jgi:hypothetical protein
MLGAPGFVLVATTARIDVTVAGALLVAHTLMLLAIVRRTPAVLPTAAVCFGLAGGMKLHGLVYAAVCAPLALFWWRERRTLGLAFGAFVVTLAPWLLKNALLLGAPFYPIGTAPRLEPWLAAIAGSTTIPAGFDTRAFAQLGESRTAFNLWDAFFAPAQLTIELDGRFYGLPPVLLLLPLALYAVRRRPRLLSLTLPPLAYLALLLMAYPKTNLRYLFPVVPALVLATVIGVRAAFPRPASTPWRLGLIVAVLGFSLATLVPAVRQRIGPNALLARWAFGRATRHEVRTQFPDRSVQALAALEDSLSGLGSNALILLLWEARGGGLPPRALADVRLSNWPLLSQTRAPESCLAGTGITHVVISGGALRYYLQRGASPEVLRLDGLREFVRRCLEEPRQAPPYEIFRVRRAPSAAGSPQPAP